jgi:hypothetical protein
MLTSADLDVLQEIYDAATVDIDDIDDIDDATMHDAIRTLITHYQTGVRDRETLIALAERHLQPIAG